MFPAGHMLWVTVGDLLPLSGTVWLDEWAVGGVSAHSSFWDILGGRAGLPEAGGEGWAEGRGVRWVRGNPAFPIANEGRGTNKAALPGGRGSRRENEASS